MDPQRRLPENQPAPGGGRIISDFRPAAQARPQSAPGQPLANSQPAASSQTIALAPGLTTQAPPAATTAPAAQVAPAPQQVEKPRFQSFAIDEPAPVIPGRKPAAKNQGLHDILSIGGVLASALLLAFCLITFVFQSYQVDGPSMQTTLENNDHLIVWKVPKTLAKASGKHYIPNRGDVVVFNEPSPGGLGQDKQLIKRVVGLPGERVTVRNDSLTVYNSEFPNGFSPDKSLPYGSVITTTPGNVDVTVQENEVFVVGDNRANSLDSRVFGPIDSDQIVGKLVLRVLPLNSIKAF